MAKWTILASIAMISFLPAVQAESTNDASASCSSDYATNMSFAIDATDNRLLTGVGMIRGGDYVDGALYLVTEVAVGIPMAMVDHAQTFVSCLIGP